MVQERSLKRLAIQLAAQLPDDERESLAVLAYCHELVTGYLRPKSAPDLRVLSGVAPWREHANGDVVRQVGADATINPVSAGAGRRRDFPGCVD